MLDQMCLIRRIFHFCRLLNLEMWCNQQRLVRFLRVLFLLPFQKLCLDHSLSSKIYELSQLVYIMHTSYMVHLNFSSNMERNLPQPYTPFHKRKHSYVANLLCSLHLKSCNSEPTKHWAMEQPFHTWLSVLLQLPK